MYLYTSDCLSQDPCPFILHSSFFFCPRLFSQISYRIAFSKSKQNKACGILSKIALNLCIHLVRINIMTVFRLPIQECFSIYFYLSVRLFSFLPLGIAITCRVLFFLLFLGSFFFFNKFIYFIIYLFIYFGCIGSSVAARGLSLVAVSRGYSSLRCVGFSLRWLLLLRSMGSRHVGFSSCGTQAQ